MALALIRSLDAERDAVTLSIDTGTNPFYQVQLGQRVRDDAGVAVLDDTYWSSAWQRNPSAGRHLDTRTRYRFPVDVLKPHSLLQLVTCKDERRGTAHSSPHRVPLQLRLTAGSLHSGPELLEGMAMSLSQRRTHDLAPSRMIGVRSARETFSRPASLEDLLGSLVQVAVPAVQQLLGSPGVGQPPAAAAGQPAAPGAAGTAPTAGNDELAALLAATLRSLLGSIAGGAGLAAPTSVRQNRLTTGYARPFLFGVDDALLAALAAPVLSSVVGPLVQALPQLLNATNQHRLNSRREDYRLIGDLLGGLDRGKLIDRLTAAGAMPASSESAPGAAELAELIELLRTAEAPAQQGPAPALPSATSPPWPRQPHSRLPSLPEAFQDPLLQWLNRPGCLDHGPLS